MTVHTWHETLGSFSHYQDCSLVVALALTATTFACADDDKDLPVAAVERVEEVMCTLGCKGYEEVEVEHNDYIEIDDAKCELGTMDIKLDPDGKIVLMSAY